MKIFKLTNNKVSLVDELESQEISDDMIIISDIEIRIGDFDPRIDINTKKNNKKHDIEDAFDILMTNGYDTGNGYFLSAEKADREAFAQDALLHNRAVELNIINSSDNVTFADKNGVPRLLTVLEYITLLINYGLWCRQQIMTKSYKMYLLENAATEEQINLI
jgi:hypothetical protein